MKEIFENCLSLNDKPIDLPNAAGLVLFADNLDRPIALLTAANIKRVAKTKLAEKIDPLDSAQGRPNKRADLKSITAKIYYSPCRCKFRLAVKHFDAVKKVFGQNYKDHITLVMPWFIKIDLSEKIPFFSVTKKPGFKNNEKTLGPFPGQKSAITFLKTLEDALGLCRKSDLVNNPTLAASCPYLQMDACVGVCAGKIPAEEYKNIIQEAFEAGVNPTNAIEQLQQQMQIASKELKFEKAAGLKKKTDKLSVLKKQNYKWTGDLKNLKIVHIDKSVKIKPEGSKKKVQTYAVFVINFFNIIDLGDFTLDNPDSIYEKICASFENFRNSQEKITDETIERFSIASYFLYRSKPSGLWLNTSNGLDKQEFQKTLSVLI
jgi:excinuclease UvrABC nuclease subunit